MKDHDPEEQYISGAAYGQEPFLTYENPDYGISIQYPANNWTKHEIDLQPYQIVYFTTNENISSGLLLGSRPVAAVSIFSEPTSDRDVNQSIQTFKDKVEGNPQNYRIIGSSNTTLTNKDLPAYEVIFYDYSQHENSIKVLETWTIKDGYKDLIIYWAEPGRFDHYLPTAQRMIDSFQITKSNNLTLQQEQTTNQSTPTDYNNTGPQMPLSNHLYNQCVRIAGKDICDFMFRRK
jgi:hypothetical protein